VLKLEIQGKCAIAVVAKSSKPSLAFNIYLSIKQMDQCSQNKLSKVVTKFPFLFLCLICVIIISGTVKADYAARKGELNPPYKISDFIKQAGMRNEYGQGMENSQYFESPYSYMESEMAEMESSSENPMKNKEDQGVKKKFKFWAWIPVIVIMCWALIWLVIRLTYFYEYGINQNLNNLKRSQNGNSNDPWNFIEMAENIVNMITGIFSPFVMS